MNGMIMDPYQLAFAGALLLVFGLLSWMALTLPTQRNIFVLRALIEQSMSNQREESDSLRAGLALVERTCLGANSMVEMRLGELTTKLAQEAGESRVLLEMKLRQMSEQSSVQLNAIQNSVTEQLQQAVERQMQTSFGRVIDQFTSVQKAMADVAAVTAQIGDLKRVFSNVKTRGGWGETQLRALLEDLLPDGSVIFNARLRDISAETVEFAVRMPIRQAEANGPRPLLAIDAKFPTSDFERLLNASDAGDREGERVARHALDIRLRLEATKISQKYIVPPTTVEFAVMYLPTDGLYAEAARIPGLIDELGQRLHVMVMGPSLLPALLRTLQLGYVTLALEQKAGQIAELLGATKREMLTMDATLDKLAKTAGTMSRTIEDARSRTRVVTRKLRGMEMMDPEAAASILELDENEDA